MKNTRRSVSYFIISCFLYGLFFSGIKVYYNDTGNPEEKIKTYTRIPDDIPLDAVKWTGGYWKERMQKLGDVYLPDVIGKMFMDTINGASFRNFNRVLKTEKGPAIGRTWGDGDCYCILESASRMVAYRQDDYCRRTLESWIPVISECVNEHGLIDTWGSLKGTTGGMDSGGNTRSFGAMHYNHGFLYAAALSHQLATGSNLFIDLASRTINAYKTNKQNNGYINDNIPQAYCNEYSRNGNAEFINSVIGYYKQRSPFGPPLREAPEIMSDGTVAMQYMTGATYLYKYTGDQELLGALQRLAENMMDTKRYITGAVGQVAIGNKPQQIVAGITYPAREFTEAIGAGYDLPNDNCYNETCTICLYMEWMYFMFRATGEAQYMDEVERSMYNSIPGCIDLDQARFFYANPQEQTASSKRLNTMYEPVNGHWIQRQFTWKRTSPMRVACCPPKVLRAFARTAEMAYSANNDGLWVNLYGENSATIPLPSGGKISCIQESEYPWNGKISLRLDKVNSKPFTLFLRIPAWVNSPVRIRLNGKVIVSVEKYGTYAEINRTWKKGDRIEMELPMPVRLMAADPRLSDDRGKIAVMRGPVVYCLEDQDIPEGNSIDSLYVGGGINLKPLHTDELGGITKLTGTMVYKTKSTKPYDTTNDFDPEKGLYQETKLPAKLKTPEKGKSVQVSMIPYYTRLNREGRYFKIWLPVDIN